jgi:hypothetical protein
VKKSVEKVYRTLQEKLGFGNKVNVNKDKDGNAYYEDGRKHKRRMQRGSKNNRRLKSKKPKSKKPKRH